MGSTLKEQNLLSRGANSFVLELTPFQKEDKTIMTIVSPERVSFPLKSLE